MRSNNRIAYIDGIRGLAIVLIVIQHAFSTISARHYPDSLVIGTYNLFAPFRLGWLGADIFFIISGYLVCQKYLGSNKRLSWKQSVNFFYQRFIRLSVPYYFLLLLTPILDKFFSRTTNWTELLVHLFYLQAWIPKWTLSYMYTPAWFVGSILWLFVFLMVFNRFFYKPTQRLFLTVILYWMVANIEVLMFVFNLHSQVLWSWFDKSPLICSYYFLLGMVVCDAQKFLEDLKIIKANKGLHYLLSGLSLVGISAILPIFYLESKMMPTSNFVIFWVVALLLILSLGSTWLTRALSTSALTFLGKISYSLYLVHCIFIYSVPKFLSLYPLNLIASYPLVHIGFNFGVYFMVTIPVTYLYYVWIEKKLTHIILNKLGLK